MPAPASIEFTDALKVSAQTLVKNAIEAGAGAGELQIYSAADVLLATITLTDPCGTVDAQGQLTITQGAAGTGAADGTAAWGQFADSDGAWVIRAPVQQGASPVSGVIVLSAISIVTGATVTLVSATVG
jgi:hypothetical protein